MLFGYWVFVSYRHILHFVHSFRLLLVGIDLIRRTLIPRFQKEKETKTAAYLKIRKVGVAVSFYPRLSSL